MFDEHSIFHTVGSRKYIYFIYPSQSPSSSAPTFFPSISESLPSNNLSNGPSLRSSYPSNLPSSYPTHLPSHPSRTLIPSLLRSPAAPTLTKSPNVACDALKRKTCQEYTDDCYFDKPTKKCYGEDKLPTCSLVTSWWKCKKLRDAFSHCVWSKKSCNEVSCGDYDGKWNKCNKEVNCNWEPITKSCLGKNELPICSKATTKWKCNKLAKTNSKCAWLKSHRICNEINQTN